MPVSFRQSLFKFSDSLASKVDIEHYANSEEVMLEALAE